MENPDIIGELQVRMRIQKTFLSVFLKLQILYQFFLDFLRKCFREFFLNVFCKHQFSKKLLIYVKSYEEKILKCLVNVWISTNSLSKSLQHLKISFYFITRPTILAIYSQPCYHCRKLDSKPRSFDNETDVRPVCWAVTGRL